MTRLSDVFRIEIDDLDAGIVVRERIGFRFHAAERAFSVIDGRTFATVAAAERAAAELSRRANLLWRSPC